jgi:hypothetical protein
VSKTDSLALSYCRGTIAVRSTREEHTPAKPISDEPLNQKCSLFERSTLNGSMISAAAHAGMATAELRRAMGRPHVRRFALAERELALEAFCLGSNRSATVLRSFRYDLRATEECACAWNHDDSAVRRGCEST